MHCIQYTCIRSRGNQPVRMINSPFSLLHSRWSHQVRSLHIQFCKSIFFVSSKPSWNKEKKGLLEGSYQLRLSLTITHFILSPTVTIKKEHRVWLADLIPEKGDGLCYWMQSLFKTQWIKHFLLLYHSLWTICICHTNKTSYNTMHQVPNSANEDLIKA